MRIFVLLAFLALIAGRCEATDLPRIFITSTTGTGNLSTWPDAHGLTGLLAADEICRTRAAVAGISDSSDYIAWLSDNADDAYCRLHGRHGKRIVKCGQPMLPVGAGPWYRMDDLPAMDIVQNSLLMMGGEAGYVPRHILFDEFGTAFAANPFESSLAFAGTLANGVSAGDDGTCSNWSSTAGSTSLGNAYHGYGNWTQYGWTCIQSLHLACLRRGGQGNALSRKRPPNARMAFVTSSQGSGNLSSWPAASGQVGLAAADAVCRNSAAGAGLPFPNSYKAWLSTTAVDARDRFEHDGPWYRTDGARITASLADLVDGVVEAPLQIDEFAHPVSVGNVWTGTKANGRVGSYGCTDWTGVGGPGNMGHSFSADENWTFTQGAFGCGYSQRIYCFADNDSLFMDRFDE